MAKTVRHTLVRETPDRDPINNEVLMIKIEPGAKTLEIWCKGRRQRFAVRFQDIYRAAYQQAARQAVTSRLRR